MEKCRKELGYEGEIEDRKNGRAKEEKRGRKIVRCRRSVVDEDGEEKAGERRGEEVSVKKGRRETKRRKRGMKDNWVRGRRC